MIASNDLKKKLIGRHLDKWGITYMYLPGDKINLCFAERIGQRYYPIYKFGKWDNLFDVLLSRKTHQLTRIAWAVEKEKFKEQKRREASTKRFTDGLAEDTYEIVRHTMGGDKIQEAIGVDYAK